MATLRKILRKLDKAAGAAELDHRLTMLTRLEHRIYRSRIDTGDALTRLLSPPTPATVSPEPRGTTPELLEVIVAEETERAMSREPLPDECPSCRMPQGQRHLHWCLVWGD